MLFSAAKVHFSQLKPDCVFVCWGKLGVEWSGPNINDTAAEIAWEWKLFYKGFHVTRNTANHHGCREDGDLGKAIVKLIVVIELWVVDI